MPVGPMAGAVPCSSILMKSSTCMDGGRLVFCGRDRNKSFLLMGMLMPRPNPRPRIGATVNSHAMMSCDVNIHTSRANLRMGEGADYKQIQVTMTLD